MPVADSIPRKIIEYLRDVLPDDIESPLTFDAVAQWHKDTGDSPIVIVVARPSVPEIRVGGYVDPNTRNCCVDIDIVWDAKDGGNDGRNYDRFEATINAIVDAMAGLQGTAILGSSVLQSGIDPDDCDIGGDVETFKYIARLKVNIQFVR